MPQIALIAALIVFVSDAWVYLDARSRVDQGRPVTVSLGSWRLETPIAWFLGCLVLWVVFLPLYLTAAGRNPFGRNSRSRG